MAKELATVTHVSASYVIALNDWGRSYFVFHSAVSPIGRYSFSDLQVGSKVRLTPIDHPKGDRGIEVEIESI